MCFGDGEWMDGWEDVKGNCYFSFIISLRYLYLFCFM